MDSSYQQRKKRKQPNYYVKRSLLFFAFFFFFFILFRQNMSLLFNPVNLLSVPSIYQNELTRLKMDDRVVFPDHILLLLVSQYHYVGITSWNKKAKGLECVYTNSNNTLIRDVLSVDEYNDIRMLVRCPLPPSNNLSSMVTLRSRSSSVVVTDTGIGGLQNSWENLAYEAVLDGNTVVVFVKGISHRQDKESDAKRFSCHFGLSNRNNMLLTTRALTAAQEVVRCVLPTSLQTHPEKAQGMHVTVSFRIPMPRRNQDHRVVVVPSLAKISSGSPALEIMRTKKHQLCACTMLWNQADSLREWITYHSWLGVEKWFIYDNNSDDQIQELIKKLDLEGFNVTRHVWPWIKTQEAGFSHCAIKARDKCNWVSFMDVDEFYYFPKGGSLRTLVSKYTSSNPSIGELRTSCRSFGPSGLTSPPKQGVTVGYTCRLQSPERHKSIVRPDALDMTLMNVVHHFHLRKGFLHEDVRQSTAVINHYKYQVWESFRAKFYRRVATYVADWQDNHNEGSRDRAPGLGTEPIEPADWRLRFCEIWDSGLRDFVLANLADTSTGDLPWSRSLGHTDIERIQ